jgi:hypothetical protein
LLSWECQRKRTPESYCTQKNFASFLAKFYLHILVLRPNFRPVGNTTLPWLALLARRLQSTSLRKPNM